MDARRVQYTRHDLHRFRVGAITADVRKIAAAIHQHPVPIKQNIVCERFRVAAIQVRHKLCSTCFRKVGAALVCDKAKLTGNGRLHAGTVQNLSFNGRTFHHFLRDQLNHEPLTGISVEMMHSADYDAGAF